MMNLTYYRGNDGYSDGVIEREILDLVSKLTPDELSKVIESDTRWPILYHLSPIRRNLLEWLPNMKGETVLEIGAGCGALTGLLCEKFKKVTAVELSKQRSEIIEQRHKKHNNLDIVVGNLNDIEFKEAFDYISLIGVLEYAAVYTDSKSPFHDFLLYLHSLLQSKGTLILAIENKYGMKYWSGSPEDHTNRYFDGIENYRFSEKGIKTFSKTELESLLKGAGFHDLTFYYPLPDYKLPMELYSESHLPDSSNHLYSPNYDSNRFVLFDEKLAMQNLIENQQFGFFANSYLVICKKN